MENFQTTLPINGGGSVVLDIWDTAGQEDLGSIRQLSYPGTNVTIFCYSCVSSGSLENIASLWLKETAQINPGTPFVLVGTKQDLAIQFPDKAVGSAQGEDFIKRHNGYEHVQCSAKNYTVHNDANVKLAFSIAVSCHLNKLQEDRIKPTGGCACCCTVL